MESIFDDFARCPPYGEGAFGYGKEDVQILEEMHVLMDLMLHMMDGDQLYHLNQYLETYNRYFERCNQYYFYRGTLHGTTEALKIWSQECGEED